MAQIIETGEKILLEGQWLRVGVDVHEFGEKFLRDGRYQIHVNLEIYFSDEPYMVGEIDIDLETGQFDFPTEWVFDLPEAELRYLRMNDINRAQLKRMTRKEVEGNLHLYRQFSFYELPENIRLNILESQITAYERESFPNLEEYEDFLNRCRTFDKDGNIIRFTGPDLHGSW